MRVVVASNQNDMTSFSEAFEQRLSLRENHGFSLIHRERDKKKRSDILLSINKSFNKTIYDYEEVDMYEKTLPFFKGESVKLLVFTQVWMEQFSNPYWLLKNKPQTSEYVPIELTGSNEHLYGTFSEDLIDFSENVEYLKSYCKFFFSMVRGRHGKFIVIEEEEGLLLKEPERFPQKAKDAFFSKIKPMVVSEQVVKKDDNEKKMFQLESTILFKDALFDGDIMFDKMDKSFSIPREDLISDDLEGADLFQEEEMILDFLFSIPAL